LKTKSPAIDWQYEIKVAFNRIIFLKNILCVWAFKDCL
jgi:hypothetical protein